MGAPSSISLNPSSGPVGTSVDLTAIDLFERPNYTKRELFTKAGSDIPSSGWNGSMSQQDGIIGTAAYSANDLSSYIKTTDSEHMFDYTDSNGWSLGFWVYISKAVSPEPRQQLIFGSNNSFLSDGDGNVNIYAKTDDPSNLWLIAVIKGYNAIAGGGYRQINIAYSTDFYDSWNHIALIWQGGNDYPLLYVNGVAQTPSSTGAAGNIYGGDPVQNIWFGARSLSSVIDRPINGYICNYYKYNGVWLQSDIDKLANLPTIQQDLTDVTPSRYTSETTCTFTVV